MKLRFFTIPVHNPQAVTDEMHAFLAAHRVVTVERQFVPDGARRSLEQSFVLDLRANAGRRTMTESSRRHPAA